MEESFSNNILIPHGMHTIIMAAKKKAPAKRKVAAKKPAKRKAAPKKAAKKKAPAKRKVAAKKKK